MAHPSGFLNTDWLKEDEHVAGIVTRNAANLLYIISYVDEMVISVCAEEQVNLYDIPREQTDGTGTVSTVETALTGSGTAFTTELVEGSFITIDEEVVGIVSITDDTNAVITNNLSSDVSGEAFTIGGYVSSVPLKRYAIAEGLWKACTSFHGSGRGERDVYYDKRASYEIEVNKALSRLTYDSILGIYDPETGTPDSKESQIETVTGFL